MNCFQITLDDNARTTRRVTAYYWDTEGGDLVFYDRRDNRTHVFAAGQWLYCEKVVDIPPAKGADVEPAAPPFEKDDGGTTILEQDVDDSE